jgi:hypothetical protein
MNMKNHEGMKMPDAKKEQKQTTGKDKNVPKKDDAAGKQKTGHEGHDMSGKDAKK